MVLELTQPERELLLELLDASHREKLHELHHTVTMDYKSFLRTRVDLIEGLRNRLEATSLIEK